MIKAKTPERFVELLSTMPQPRITMVMIAQKGEEPVFSVSAIGRPEGKTMHGFSVKGIDEVCNSLALLHEFVCGCEK